MIHQQCCWDASHLHIVSPSMVMEDVDACQKTQDSFEPTTKKKKKKLYFSS